MIRLTFTRIDESPPENVIYVNQDYIVSVRAPEKNELSNWSSARSVVEIGEDHFFMTESVEDIVQSMRDWSHR